MNIYVIGKEVSTNKIDSEEVKVKMSLGKNLMSSENKELADKVRWIVAENLSEIKEKLKLDNHPFENSLFRYPFETLMGKQFIEGFITVEDDGLIDIKFTSVKVDKFGMEDVYIKNMKSA